MTEEKIIDLTGNEHIETGQPTTPMVVDHVKKLLDTYPDAKTTIYFWLTNQAKSSLQRVH